MIVFVILFPIFIFSQISIFLSPQGSDTKGNGTISNPFLTPQKAQGSVREIIKTGQTITVYFRGGIYPLQQSVSFTNEDSGHSSSPITWTNYQNEDVFIQGSVDVSDIVKPVSDESILTRFDKTITQNLYEVDLSKFTITPLGITSPNSILLFSSTRSFIYSRFPSFPHQYFTTVDYEGNESWSIPSNDVGEWIKKWQSLPSIKGMDDDVRIHGFPSWNWYDEHLYIKSLTPKDFSIDISRSPIHYPQRIKQSRWNFYNLLDALDDGMMYINRETKTLYFVDETKSFRDTTTSKYYVAVLDKPLFQFTSTQNLEIDGLNFQHGQTTGLSFSNTLNVKVSNCHIRQFGGSGVSVTGTVTSHFLFSSNIVEDAYFHGVSSQIGNRLTLTQSNSVFSDNTFKKVAQWKTTYQPYISAYGCGINVTRNTMTDYHPHSAILFGGNYITLDFNLITHAVSSCADCGAIYGGRDWTFNSLVQGNVIKDCFSDMSPDTNAIYLDDEMSNIHVLSNTISNIGRGIMLGGGRWNIISQNKVTNASVTAFHYDWRGENWQHSSCSVPSGVLQQNYFKMKINESAVWQKQFPWLVNLLKDDPCVPKYDQFVNNQYCNVKKVFDVDTNEIIKRDGIVSGNVEKC